MANKTGNKKDNHINGTLGDDTLLGRGGNDVLKGLAGSDQLKGGGGNDVIEGGPGADEMHGGNGIDTVSYANSSPGVNVQLSPTGQIMVAVGGDAEGDTGDGFENITGSSFNDFLAGNNRANVLRGGAGDFDQLIGNGGKDKLFGGAGIDELNGGKGADTLHGGPGTDSISYSGSAAGVKVVLGKNGKETTGKGGEAKGDKIKKVENIGGSQHDDVLTGNNLANRLVGGNGERHAQGEEGGRLLNRWFRRRHARRRQGERYISIFPPTLGTT